MHTRMYRWIRPLHLHLQVREWQRKERIKQLGEHPEVREKLANEAQEVLVRPISTSDIKELLSTLRNGGGIAG